MDINYKGVSATRPAATPTSFPKPLRGVWSFGYTFIEQCEHLRKLVGETLRFGGKREMTTTCVDSEIFIDITTSHPPPHFHA
ncbi:hypothetical protein WH47_04781 [Habropoda laboriosa]|uniref:Uncharacterized protein n=1 Tax=Habropoda laboriosa TaxID=597456 RepID=A0A0L7QXI7_9HYME|nr:hypothetical protein WH47_04781 [Habropoda laboriosa]